MDSSTELQLDATGTATARAVSILDQKIIRAKKIAVAPYLIGSLVAAVLLIVIGGTAFAASNPPPDNKGRPLPKSHC